VDAQRLVTRSVLQSSEPVSLFESGYVNTPGGHSGNWNPFVVSADGQRFLIPRPEANFAGALTNSPITVVENWPAGLKK
jgi:hypothetical protein